VNGSSGQAPRVPRSPRDPLGREQGGGAGNSLRTDQTSWQIGNHLWTAAGTPRVRPLRFPSGGLGAEGRGTRTPSNGGGHAQAAEREDNLMTTAGGGYVVTGVTGGLGGRVARRLAERGVRQRVVARDPGRVPELPGAEVAVGSYDDREGLRRAFEGAHTLFMVSASEDPDRMRLHGNVVGAATDAGVGRVVYTSFDGAGPACTFTFGRDHWHTEQRIQASGLRHTFLRDNLYIDFLPLMVGGDGVIRGPAGDGRVAAVARDDIAEVAVAVLLDDSGGHDGRAYDLTGPEALTMAEAAEELSRAAGRTVTYHAETLEEAYASRAHYGAPDWEVAGWVTTYVAIANGDLGTVSGDVAAVAGHPPIGLREFLRRNPDSYRRLAEPAGT
jgi:NAD(P)H dehydrogenase (quinone)